MASPIPLPVVAVTTCSGQLGRAIVAALLDLNPTPKIVGLARTPSSAAGLTIEVRPGDYDAPEQLRKSLDGVDRLLLISGNQAPGVRVEQHRNVIAAASKAGVKRIVFTSVQGVSDASAGSVGASFRQTEADVKASEMDWVIGRNGVYIEPDVEYAAQYIAAGGIANSAGEGRCGYTTRAELGQAYARLLMDPEHPGQTYNLSGPPLTQADLAAHMSDAFGVDLTYRPMSQEAYLADRTEALGPVLGPIISGIYDNIRSGHLCNSSDYEAVVGRPHTPWDAYFATIAKRQGHP